MSKGAAEVILIVILLVVSLGITVVPAYKRYFVGTDAQARTAAALERIADVMEAAQRGAQR